MNPGHRELCASEGWFGYLREELVPWMLGERELGERVLEIGPGPGRSTDLLRARSASLTAVEPDPAAAAALAGGSPARTSWSSRRTRATCRSTAGRSRARRR